MAYTGGARYLKKKGAKQKTPGIFQEIKRLCKGVATDVF